MKSGGVSEFTGEFFEIDPGEQARLMTIRPDNSDGIVSDGIKRLDLNDVRDLIDIEDPFARKFVHAGGAWTTTSEETIG